MSAVRLLLGLLLLLVGVLVWPFPALRRLLWRELSTYPEWFRYFVMVCCVLVAGLALAGFVTAIVAY